MQIIFRVINKLMMAWLRQLPNQLFRSHFPPEIEIFLIFLTVGSLHGILNSAVEGVDVENSQADPFVGLFGSMVFDDYKGIFFFFIHINGLFQKIMIKNWESGLCQFQNVELSLFEMKNCFSRELKINPIIIENRQIYGLAFGQPLISATLSLAQVKSNRKGAQKSQKPSETEKYKAKNGLFSAIMQFLSEKLDYKMYTLQQHQQSPIISQLYSYPQSVKAHSAPCVDDADDRSFFLKQIQGLISRNHKLSDSKTELEGTIADLRRVLSISKEQHFEEFENAHEENCKLKERANSLSSALRTSHRNGNHLANCAMFWDQHL